MAKIRAQKKTLDDDLEQRLQKIADDKQTTIISFVAPHGVRTSPVTFASASIEEEEIYRLEKIVEEAVKNKATDSLHLVIHTPGGEMHASYKIARFLRSKFTQINAYVPYEAASGGTILCCAANELYIGDLGNITSFDPQVRYKNTRVAAHAFTRSVEFIQEQYGEMSPEEIPSPWQQMADKLDPVIYDEMSTALLTSKVCALRLLKHAGYKEEDTYKIAIGLTNNMFTHEFPFFAQEAKEMGFNVKDSEKELMEVYRDLVSCRLKQESPTHVIDSYFPKLLTAPVPAPAQTSIASPQITETPSK